MAGGMHTESVRAGPSKGPSKDGGSLAKVFGLVRELGLAGAFKKIRSILLHRLHSGRLDRVVVPMDAEESAKEIPLSEVTTVGANEEHGVNYVPTPARVFERLVAELPIRPQDYSFVDFGCGKGRLLPLAAEIGFRRVVGVEFAVELAEAAQARLAAYRQQAGDAPGDAPEIACHTMDAAEFAIPEGPCVVFMFNPFAEPVLGKVIGNLERAHREAPRRIYAIYYNPAHVELFEGSKLFRRRDLSLSTRSYLAALSPYKAEIFQSHD